MYLRYIRETDEGLLEMEGRPNEPRHFYDQTHTLRKVLREGKWITQESPDFPMLGKPVLEFPLHPGRSWSFESRVRTGAGILNYSRTYTVRGCEQVTVPAGTFFAVVIEEEQAVLGGPQHANGRRTWWYAPEVKFFVKLAHGTSSPGFWSAARDWVLIAYQPGPAPLSQTPKPPGPSAPQVAAAALAAAPAPTWEKGYEWKFRWASPRGSGTFVWSIAGEETIGGVAHYIMKSGTRDAYYSKAELAWLMERVGGVVETQASPANRRFAWPLQMGKEWEDKYRWENPGERTSEEQIRRYKVDALETVTVPAGTFQVFRVVARDQTGRFMYEYWYSPEVGWIVKDRWNFSYGVRERELLEYTLKPTKAP